MPPTGFEPVPQAREARILGRTRLWGQRHRPDLNWDNPKVTGFPVLRIWLANSYVPDCATVA